MKSRRRSLFLRLAGTEYDGLFLLSSAVLGNHQRRARADGGRHAEGERAPRCQGTAARTHQCLLQVRRLPDTSFWFPSIPFLLNITIFLFLSVLRYFLLSVYPSILSFFLSVVHYFLLSPFLTCPSPSMSITTRITCWLYYCQVLPFRPTTVTVYLAFFPSLSPSIFFFLSFFFSLVVYYDENDLLFVFIIVVILNLYLLRHSYFF